MASLINIPLSANALRFLPALQRSFELRHIIPDVFLTMRVFNVPVAERELRVLWDFFDAEASAGRAISLLPIGGAFDYDTLPWAKTDTLRQYSFNVRVKGTDLLTGEPTSRMITVSTDSLLTRSEIESQALEYVYKDYEKYPITNSSAEILGGKQRAQFLTL